MEAHKGFSIGNRVWIDGEGLGAITGWDADSVKVRIDADGVEVSAAWAQTHLVKSVDEMPTHVERFNDPALRIVFTNEGPRLYASRTREGIRAAQAFLRARGGCSKRFAGWVFNMGAKLETLASAAWPLMDVETPAGFVVRIVF